MYKIGSITARTKQQIKHTTNMFCISSKNITSRTPKKLQLKDTNKVIKKKSHSYKCESTKAIDKIRINEILHHNPKQLTQKDNQRYDLVKKQNSLHLFSKKINSRQKLSKIFSQKSKQNKQNNKPNNKLKSKPLEQLINKKIKKRPPLPKIKKQISPNINIKDFTLTTLLGKGRFGQVKTAFHNATGLVFALKIIELSQIKRLNMFEQLKRQLEIITVINHPNIVKTYVMWIQDGCAFVLMELMQSLWRKIARKALKQSYASKIVKQVIKPLIYLHRIGIIHRDIKPQNLLQLFGVIKITDFGWSVYSPQLDTFCGTMDYICPQIVKGNYYDQKVDVWSIGVLIYELCCGKPPFLTNINGKESQQQILRCNLYFPEHLSQEIMELIRMIVIPEPNNRPCLEQVLKHSWFNQQEQVSRKIEEIHDLFNY